MQDSFGTTNEPTSWFWDFEDGSYSSEENPIHSFINNGVYNVCLTAANGGGVNTSCDLITIAECLPPPVCAFDFAVVNEVVLFTDNSENNPETWLWEFGDGSVSEMQHPSHVYIDEGSYNVCLTVTNATGTSKCCNSINTLGIALNDYNGFAIRIYPNPTTNQIYITTQNQDLSEISSVEFVNVAGEKTKLPISCVNPQMLAAETKGLPPGMYMLILSNVGITYSTPVVVLK